MLAVTLCRVPPTEHAPFLAAARDALTSLAQRPGFHRGHLGRALDDETQWVLSTEWGAVGDYRRGLSAYDVKVALAPLMVFMVDAPSAYEVVATVETGPGGS